MANHKRNFECEIIGEEMSSLVGIGIIVGFVGQAFVSLLLSGWIFLFSKLGYLDVHHDEDSIHHAMDRKRLEIVSDILMVGNDIQMLLGISYMTTVFASVASLDTYHLHLIFDIVSFVGVSNASALVCWTFCTAKLNKHKTTQRSKRVKERIFAKRYRVTYLFALLFLALTILLCIRLDEWAPAQPPGRCYDARLISYEPAAHPTADMVYVAVTASWLLIVMALAIFLGARRRRLVLALSFVQFPVHLYMAIALRTANQGKLEGDDGNENRWDFGQTTAVLLLAIALTELITKAREYVKFEKDLVRNGLGKRMVDRRELAGTGSSTREMNDGDDDEDEEGGVGRDAVGDGDGAFDGGLMELEIRAIEQERREEERSDRK